MVKHIHKTVLFISGILALVLGFIGIFLPLLPTTPFVILAALCFSKSSERMHGWLLNHKVFGPIIREWEAYGVIRRKYKWIASVSMCVLVSYPLIFKISQLWMKALVVTMIACVLVFIWSRPSEPPLKTRSSTR